MIVGASAVDITPDFETELCGFALREQPATGVLDRIFARCVFLDDEAGTQLLWVVADVLAIGADLVADFRAWAAGAFGLRPDQVMLAATHTHHAPAVITLNAAGRASDRYVRLLSDRLRRAAREAFAARRACEVVAASARCELAIDRRNRPTKHVDPVVWSLGFREAGGGPFLAAVLNYTMHPVSLGHHERRVSPDWCGAAAASLVQSLHTASGPEPVVLVTNGAAGNVNPPFHHASREQIAAWGARIAGAVAETLTSVAPVRDARLAVRAALVPLPLDWHDADDLDRLADRMIRDVAPKSAWPAQFVEAVSAWRDALTPVVTAGHGREHAIELQAARIGDVTVVTVNGEVFCRFTDDLRRATADARLFVIGYANAAFGYIPTREAYAEGGYEVETAHFFYNSFRPAPGGLELLVQRAAELVRSF